MCDEFDRPTLFFTRPQRSPFASRLLDWNAFLRLASSDGGLRPDELGDAWKVRMLKEAYEDIPPEAASAEYASSVTYVMRSIRVARQAARQRQRARTEAFRRPLPPSTVIEGRDNDDVESW